VEWTFSESCSSRQSGYFFQRPEVNSATSSITSFRFKQREIGVYNRYRVEAKREILGKGYPCISSRRGYSD
jgi:hypothetical protein